MTPIDRATHEEHVAKARTHAAAGRNLTIRGYAEAIGISTRGARELVRKLALHVEGGRSVAPPAVTAVESVGSRVMSHGEESAAVQALLSSMEPIDPRDPFAAVRQAAREEAVTVGIRLWNSTIRGLTEEATLRALPVASGPVTSDDAAAVAAAGAIERRSREEIVAEALTIHAHDVESGERVRRLWAEHYRSEFPEGPGQMVKECVDFWWRYRDAIRSLQERIDQDALTIADLSSRLDPNSQRERVMDQVLRIFLLLEFRGIHVPPAWQDHLVRTADAYMSGEPLFTPGAQLQVEELERLGRSSPDMHPPGHGAGPSNAAEKEIISRSVATDQKPKPTGSAPSDPTREIVAIGIGGEVHLLR